MKQMWTTTSKPDSKESYDFSLKQFNILAQGLANNDISSSVPEQALQWDHRKHLLTLEILMDSPDILCLEEVDCFSYILEHLNKPQYLYNGFFVPKPTSPCLTLNPEAEGTAMGPDGTAIFYKKSKFSLVAGGFFVLTEEDEKPTDSTLVWKHLKHEESGKEVMVMATHLKAKEEVKFKKMRMQQAASLNHHVSKLKEVYGVASIIIAGDFNASHLEEDEYSVYKYVKEQCGVESAYKKVMGTEPEYTTWKMRRNGVLKKKTIDFIMFNQDALEVREVLKGPAEEEIGKNGLPNLEFPSDHVPLMAKFKFIK